MKRVTAIVLAACLFCAGAASVVLWILSLHNSQGLVLATNSSDGDWLTADNGQLIYREYGFRSGRYGYNPLAGTVSFLNFQWDRTQGGKTTVAIPFWAPGLLFLVTGIIYVFHGTAREFGRGFCRQCGYDLRASQERCPECGTPLAAKGPFEA
jgi:hypothetical protein